MQLKEKLARLDRMMQPVISRPDVMEVTEASLPGEECSTEAGRCWRNRTRYNLSTTHGSFTVGDILNQDPSRLKFIAKNSDYSQLSIENLLFIDTESTGLSGGVGTLAFLVGIGYFRAGEFRIDQYFMRDFSEEMPVLHSCIDQLQSALPLKGGVVSYNGKSYDLPLLLNRATIHRLGHPPRHFPHIDVLHAARRLWKYAVPECSLTTIESKILQIERVGDVPGFMIPEIYFNYLRTGNCGSLLPVFYHNQMDILTMVGLIHEMLSLFSGVRADHFDEVDWLKMGESYASVNAHDQELALYQELLNHRISEDKRTTLLLQMGAVHKRKLCFNDAVPCWQEVLTLDPSCLEAYEELAKVYEHRIIDLPKAFDYTSRALENLTVKMKLRYHSDDDLAYQSFLHRSRRLEQKMRRGGVRSTRQ